jgi:hypothetical protein
MALHMVHVKVVRLEVVIVIGKGRGASGRGRPGISDEALTIFAQRSPGEPGRARLVASRAGADIRTSTWGCDGGGGRNW